VTGNGRGDFVVFEEPSGIFTLIGTTLLGQVGLAGALIDPSVDRALVNPSIDNLSQDFTPAQEIYQKELNGLEKKLFRDRLDPGFSRFHDFVRMIRALHTFNIFFTKPPIGGGAYTLDTDRYHWHEELSEDFYDLTFYDNKPRDAEDRYKYTFVQLPDVDRAIMRGFVPMIFSYFSLGNRPLRFLTLDSDTELEYSGEKDSERYSMLKNMT